jgi:hypothetical protein
MGIDLSSFNPMPKIINWLQDFVYKKFGDYGEVTDLHINLKQKTMDLVFLLRGEEQVIKVQLSDFTIKNINGQDFLQIGRVQTSREWLTLIGKDLLDGKFGSPDIPINKNHAFLLKFFI